MSRTHVDATSILKGEEPSWAGLPALNMGCPFAFLGRQGHGLSLEPGFCLPSSWHLNPHEKRPFPTAWSLHGGDARSLFPAAPGFCGSWRCKSFLSWILAGWGVMVQLTDLEWVTPGWQATCRQQWPWWVEVKPKQPYLEWLLWRWSSDTGPWEQVQVWEPTRSSHNPLCSCPKFIVQSLLERSVFSLTLYPELNINRYGSWKRTF